MTHLFIVEMKMFMIGPIQRNSLVDPEHPTSSFLKIKKLINKFGESFRSITNLTPPNNT